MINETTNVIIIREKFRWTRGEMATVLGISISEEADLEHRRTQANPAVSGVIENLASYKFPESTPITV